MNNIEATSPLLSSQSSNLSANSPLRLPLMLFVGRSKRKLSELSLQNTSATSIASKSAFIAAQADIIKLNDNNDTNSVRRKRRSSKQPSPVPDKQPSSVVIKNSLTCRPNKHQAKIRICASGKLRGCTRTSMVDRKTSTGSSSSQQSGSNEPSSPTSASPSHHAGRAHVKRRRSSTTTLRQILSNPSQLFYWNHTKLKPNLNQANNNNLYMSNRRQLQKTMSVDDDDYEDVSPENELENDGFEEEEFPGHDSSSDTLYPAFNSNYEEEEEEEEEENDEEESQTNLRMDLVSGMRMMRRLTVSSKTPTSRLLSNR